VSRDKDQKDDPSAENERVQLLEGQLARIEDPFSMTRSFIGGSENG
jgi:hypothetical protein